MYIYSTGLTSGRSTNKVNHYRVYLQNTGLVDGNHQEVVNLSSPQG